MRLASLDLRKRLREPLVWWRFGLLSAPILVFLVLGEWLFGAFRVPVGNTGLYAMGMLRIAHGDFGGFDSFIGTPIAADAGEWVAYLVAPWFAVFGFAGLWTLWGGCVAVSALVADVLLDGSIGWLGRVLVAAAVVGSPVIIENFFTSWDFNILFVPVVLLLELEIRRRGRVWCLAGLALLGVLLKDETGILLAVYAVSMLVFRRNQIAGYLTILVVSVVGFALSSVAILELWPNTPSQVALHFMSVGGRRGFGGVLVYVFTHPGVLVRLWGSNEGYLFRVLFGGAGLASLSAFGVPLLAVLSINVLGGGPLGSLMSQPQFEFTLLAVPFVILGMVDVLNRWPKIIRPAFVVFVLFALVEYAGFMPSAWATVVPASSKLAWSRLEGAYTRMDIKPVVVTTNMAGSHFIAAGVAGVGVDSLHRIAAEASVERRPVWLAFDWRMGNDGDFARWITRISALARMGVIKEVGRLSSGTLHVYRLQVTPFLRGGSSVLATKLSVPRWACRSLHPLMMELAPGIYLVGGQVSSVVGSRLRGHTLIVPPSPYVSSVGFDCSGSVGLTRIG